MLKQIEHESSVVVDEVCDSDHLTSGVSAGDHEADDDDLVDDPQFEDDRRGSDGGREQKQNGADDLWTHSLSVTHVLSVHRIRWRHTAYFSREPLLLGAQAPQPLFE